MREQTFLVSALALKDPGIEDQIKAKADKSLPFFYKTFHRDGWRTGRWTFVFTESQPQNILVTGPEADIKEVVDKVISANPHMKLYFAELGHSEDDFIQLRVTVLLTTDISKAYRV